MILEHATSSPISSQRATSSTKLMRPGGHATTSITDNHEQAQKESCIAVVYQATVNLDWQSISRCPSIIIQLSHDGISHLCE